MPIHYISEKKIEAMMSDSNRLTAERQKTKIKGLVATYGLKVR